MSANDSTSKEDLIDSADEDNSSQDSDSSDDDEKSNASDTSLKETESRETLQIVTFSNPKDDSKAPFDINLHQENLNSILEPVEHRPVCILGIVGPPNNGKSLLLNYIRLQLEAMVKEKTDFDITKIDKPVEGFYWCTKMGPKTKGIRAWHKPFLIEADGTDIAVILLDSQGLNDENLKLEEISSIFGLSFLYSSILIYNLTNDITANDLKLLTTYYMYGKSFKEASEECTKEPPFQKLSLLVRDWSPRKHSYGAEGGKALLREKLRTFSTDVIKVTTNDFSKSFREVESYLMPSIDQSALVQDQGFKGQTVGLNPEFLEHLSAYITGILKKLLVVRGLGNDVTAQEFSTYAIQFVNLFNSTLEENRLPTDDELCQVRCVAYHDTVIRAPLQKFQKTLQNKSKPREYLTEVELKKIKEIGTEQATSMYNKADKLAEYAAEYREKLVQELENFYESFKQNNTDSRTAYVSKCTNIANEEYKKQLNETFPFDENKITIYEDDDILALSKTVGERVTLAFNSKFAKEEMENRQILRNSVEEVLNSSLQTYLDKNKLNKDKANEVLTKLTSEIIQTYETTMQTFMNDFPFFETPLLNLSHKLNIKIAINHFEQADKPDDQHIVNQHREHVHNKLEKMYNTFNETQNEKMSTKMKAGIELLNEQLEGLKTDLRQKAQEGSSAEELQDYYEIEAESITQRFKHLNPFPEDASQHDVLKTKLQGQLQLVYDTVRREELDIKRKLEDKLKGECSRCFELYTDAMDIFKNGEFLDENKLLKANETNSNTAILSFDQKTFNDDLERVSFHRKQLTTAIEGVFLKLKTTNDAAIKLAKSEAKNLKTDCLKYYTDAMREATTSCETNEAFTAEHEKVKVEVIESFNNKWSAAYQSKEFLEEFIKDLNDSMDVPFPEILEVFLYTKKTDNEKTNSVKKEAYGYYHEEMETHMKNNHFIKHELLRKMHDQAAQTALKRCTDANALKETQITILKQSLEKSYQKYEDKITMILNYEFGSEPAIGIDLGTTYCCVAVFFRGRTIVIRNAQGSNTTASYVCINPNGNHTIGNPAKENAFRQPENTVYDAKRILGRSFADEQLQDDMKFWPFTVVDGEEGPTIQIGQKQYPPEQIASILLRDLAKQAEEIIGIPIKRAVVTVPAYFTDGQRQATKDAADMAGLELLQILDEPTAAALAYKLERFHEDARKALIYDLGGGTFDISIIEMEGGNIKILNKDGDTHLGGEDFDKAMMVYCAAEFKKQHGLDPFEGKDSTQKQDKDAAKQRLRRLQSFCESGKKDLATSITTTISIDGFFKDKDLRVAVSRTKFEQLNAALFQKTLEIVDRSLKEVGLAKNQIDDIVLVGGSTRIPKVKEMLSAYFDGKVLNHAVHPDEAVAYGAAVQAALLNGGNAKKELTFGKIEDVTPMSLGVEAIVDGVEGAFSPIILKNTTIPTIHKEVYRTAKDNQESVMVRIFQGESPIAKQNKFLGEFGLTGIPLAPAGRECIDVVMEIDTMGVLSVKAVVKSTRGVQKLVVSETKPTRISPATKLRVLQEMKVQAKA